MRSTSRLALRKRFEFLRDALSADDLAELHERFAQSGKHRVRDFLQEVRDDALGIATASSKAALARKIAGRGNENRILGAYAAVAWAARALVLVETLEHNDLDVPSKSAADAALRCLREFEGHDVWLWPFESEPPWPDENEDVDGEV